MKTTSQNMLMYASLILLMTATGFTSCKKEPLIESLPYQKENIQDSSSITKDVFYKSNLHLDIYHPTGNVSGKNPVIVFIHGGGWIKGDKSGLEFGKFGIVDSLRSLGFYILSINYTLLDGNQVFPKNIVDCKDAVRWVRKNADRYGFDPNRIGVWGGSAGGHLALLTACTQEQEFIGDLNLMSYSSKVDYVIDFYGPTDLESLFLLSSSAEKLVQLKDTNKQQYDYLNHRMSLLFGVRLEENTPLITKNSFDYSPINRLSHVSAPVLIIHGDQDKAVPVTQSQSFAQALTNKGSVVRYIELEGVSHNFKNRNATQEALILNNVIDFVVAYSK